MQVNFDRCWYNTEETEVANPEGEDTNDLDDLQKIRKMFKKEASIESWERQLLSRSGYIEGERYNSKEDVDHQKTHVQLVYNYVKPPFLNEVVDSLSFDVENESIQPVKDPSSDMAILARKGSLLVKRLRERKEVKKKMNLLQGEGSKLHEIMRGSEKKTFSTPKEDKFRDADMYSQDLDTIKKQKTRLPAFACRSELMNLIRENQIVVVVGETGSGKTTQIPQFLYEEGYGKLGIIGCTQPRRVAAMSIAKRVSSEMGCDLGSTVGYSIRFEDITSPQTIIKYMTDGVLLRETLKDVDIERYSVIIIDEAHERSLQTDILLGLLKGVVSRRKDLKLIITSATMNSTRFSEYFGNVPIFNIPGRTFKVDISYLQSIPDDYVDTAVKEAIKIHIASPPGDILVFMTGQEDIEATCEGMREKLSLLDKCDDINILPIYSQLPADVQARIFEKSSARKVIVATNIAETSLTVDGIKYVIDTGFAKIKVYNPRIGMDALQIYPISQAAANQRSGRAGRTGPGSCFRLYTESAYRSEFYSNNIPEIQRTNLSNVVLLLKSLGVVDILDFDFLDPPSKETLATSLHQLWILGGIDDYGKLTDMGKQMVEFPLDPPLSRMLIESGALGCYEDILTIVSMLSVPQVFQRPKELQQESDSCREKFLVDESDHLTLLNVYNQWKSHGMSEKWSQANFINHKSLFKASEVREQISVLFQQASVNKSNNLSNDWALIRQCIAVGYIHKVARFKSIGEYYNLRTGLQCYLHPTSALFGSVSPSEYVVFHELILTSKEYMSCVTTVSAEWIARACPQEYSMRTLTFGPEGINCETISYKPPQSPSNDNSKHVDLDKENEIEKHITKKSRRIRRAL